MRKFRSQISADIWSRYVDEGRICLFVLFAFPEALEVLRKEFPGIEVSAATVLNDDLRACDDEAGIFETEGDRKFAKDVLQQIGRELSPSAPLGHGAMGALVVFHNATPNNTLPIFWSAGSVQERPWKPLFPRS
ncbi:phosphoribosyltransferase-like protein [Burkholderia sp. LMG 21824]|uniref:phosphoribosyltransferase-like protein n=1 Tax=Burkholderia sp. LMG 21824 TaxID=3158172 RepID=UPI003C2DB92E